MKRLFHVCLSFQWTKGQATVWDVLPTSWQPIRLFVLLLPAAAAAVHLDCIWLSTFSSFPPKKGRRNYREGSKPGKGKTQSISLHFVNMWMCASLRASSTLRPATFLHLDGKDDCCTTRKWEQTSSDQPAEWHIICFGDKGWRTKGRGKLSRQPAPHKSWTQSKEVDYRQIISCKTCSFIARVAAETGGLIAVSRLPPTRATKNTARERLLRLFFAGNYPNHVT